MNRMAEGGFRAVSLTTASRFAEASALYREVFGYQDPEYGLNPRLLGALASNGGSVVGILDHADRLVAFAYGFCGTDRRGFYHYSQSAVVAAGQQGLGLGRMLKHTQREAMIRARSATPISTSTCSVHADGGSLPTCTGLAPTG
jgi:predicted GNAT superfamily acetyltransferase